MLGVEIEFGNNQIRLETSSYKPPKAKTPARTQGFFSVSDGGPGRNRTTDTRIFKYPPIDRFRFDFKGLSHQSRLV